MRLVVVAVLLLAARSAWADCTLDNAPDDRWHAVRDHDVAWLVSPCRTRELSLGVNVVDGGASAREAKGKVWYSWTAFDVSLDAWAARARDRLSAWGFDSVGGWSLDPARLHVPAIPDLELGRESRFHWFDPWSRDMAETMRAAARRLTASTRASPWRIGYYLDNEVGWWGGALFTFYGQKPAENATKQRWLALLREHYRNDWHRFTADFVPPDGVGDWAGLGAATGVTKLRPGGAGAAVVRAWTRLVAERYYALASAAVRAADPGALVFGDRLPIYYDPDAVRAEVLHVDVVAVNYNLDAPDGWAAPYFFDGLHALGGGKPLIVSEWFFAADENRTGNLNRGHLMTVATQALRAAGAAGAVARFATIPDLLGMHWFQYADHPKGGRADGEDYDFGLVDIDDRPYEELTKALTAANRAAPAGHQTAAYPLNRHHDRRHLMVPYARLEPAAATLRDWPKEAALLPPLIADPGDVAFGEAYLAWDERGLHLATIGQDYYDVGLLAYDGAFPLSEAYRLDLGIDAGAGARHFSLFMIPPRTKTSDHPPMTAALCVTASTGIPPATSDPTQPCPAVPGGIARYLGADQPRITATIFLPWSALGREGPPPGGRLRVDLSAGSWFRARWMSLSGHAPHRLDPGRWATASLAPPATPPLPADSPHPAR